MSNLENIKDTQVHQGFITKKVEIPTPLGGTVERTYIKIDKDEPFVKILQNLTDMEELYNSEIQINAQELYPYIKSIQQKVDSGEFCLIELLVWLNEHFKNKIEQLENMNKSNKINFDNIQSIFPVGTKFVGYIHNNQLVGSMVHSNRMVDTWSGRMFKITGICNMPIGSELKQIHKDFYINEFGGVRSIEDLEVRPMTKEDEEFLRSRGEIFKKLCLGAHHYEYSGNMCINTGYGYLHFKADGRVMVDALGFDKSKPGYLNYYKSDSTKMHEINDDNIVMCWPYLFGFSFGAKKWGEMYVDHLKEIKYDDSAFDYLVLDPYIKKMMKALILNVKMSFKDIIGGKSGGCIFMLHGPPGVGKTLTCEAVAELLHKPLYSVTVGELGTDVDSLEKRLNNILEIANAWDAVILIDEADIFMEARNKNDIERNGMVSIFLRLLERHQGVMFLTTNRNEDLDPAFKSRISIIIGYEPLGIDARKQVWTNLLKASGLHLDETSKNELAQIELNGRQIKNAIRMTQSLILDKEFNSDSNQDTNQVIKQVIKFM